MVLSLKEFRDARAVVSLPEAAERIQLDLDWREDAVSAILFTDDLFAVQLRDGQAWTIIERSEYRGEIEPMEA